MEEYFSSHALCSFPLYKLKSHKEAVCFFKLINLANILQFPKFAMAHTLDAKSLGVELNK